ncbi:cupin domain-containing protein [Actinomycetospora sp. CA-084318]|uniref:cupin domain-containing protein n=1 Tax=Actinomycetospora sp. CA-084318 TaxID=3239892 RepID=UPI003D969ED3
MSEPFHPDLPDRPAHTRVHLVRSADLTGDTAQSGGMRRLEAVSGKSVGSSALWTGETHVAPDTASSDHHHGESETSIYVVSGRPRFVFHDGEGEVVLQTEPGDYVYVPPWVPHREENPDPEHPAVVVISRTTQEAIVVNLPALTPLES